MPRRGAFTALIVLLASVAFVGPALAADGDAPGPAERAKSLKAKADFLVAAGQLDDAAVAYKDALLSDPTLTPAREALGLLLARTGRYDEAILELEEGMKRDPKWKLGLLHVARTNQMAGRLPEAVLMFRLYLGSLKKKDPDALRGLGDCLAEMGDREAAIKTYNEYLKVEKRKSEAPHVARIKEAIAKLAAGPAPEVMDFEAVGTKAPPSKAPAPGPGEALPPEPDPALAPGAAAKASADPPIMPFPGEPTKAEKAAAEKAAKAEKAAAEKAMKAEKAAAEKAAKAEKAAAPGKPLLPFPPPGVDSADRDPKPLLPFPGKGATEDRDPKPLLPFPGKDATEDRDPKPLLGFPGKAAAGERDPKPLLPFPLKVAAADRDPKPLLPFPAKPTRTAADEEPKTLGLLIEPAPSGDGVVPVSLRPAEPIDVPEVDIGGDLAAGDVAFSRGDYRTAEMLYLAAAEEALYHAEAWYKLGAARLLLGRVDAAIYAWRHALALDPTNEELRDRLERLYELRERMVKHAVLEPPKGPPPPEMRLIGAEDLIAAGRPGAALVEIDAVLAKREGSADGLFARGTALLALGRYEEAAESYRLARAAEPDWAAPVKALGDVYRRLGDERLARYYYELFLIHAEYSSRPADPADVAAVKAILGR